MIANGPLRAALVKIPFLAKEDADGQFSGVAPDLANEMARQLGVACLRFAFDTPDKGIAALRAGRADVTFLAPTPARLRAIDFGPAFMELEVTLMVPANSAIGTHADADQPDRRIVVYEGTAVEDIMRRTISKATLVPVPILGHRQGCEFLMSGTADAIAHFRHALVTYQPDLPGSRVLPGSYGSNPLAIGFLKGHAGAASFIRAFTAGVIASGFVARSIAAAGVHGAIVPAAS